MSVASNVVPFNPLERKHLGASVAQAMLAQPAQPLANLPQFEGAGIYAIYYTGPFACYAALSSANQEGRFALPIYVGKAVPEGARIGGGTGAAGSDLQKRLREHARSVAQAENLDVADFHCRYLVVEDIWIPLGESLLIAKFAPVWNTTVAGFGNHAPGKGRNNGAKPRWDQLHPGRPWALALAEQPVSAEEIAREAESYLRDFTIPTSQLVEVAPALPVPPPVASSNEETDI
ncbi:Eco29kI family restriction endonuclease [Xylophilus ampelinus]|uniref:Eco29kI restriction endonuclease n=1 Tax=Xylophilus ampelinus TaxID=54067 RepID=A0A318SR51_9BURK|nr:Eco29kI family restriction endonuclease [Xylophilus ampelinus]MCS4511187.1 Eco29kI family restriction endonuclease [Xylophilus ampelinus]PYE75060.1 Eco29kI restriction endonuclease [Xylophilus ampelinus]